LLLVTTINSAELIKHASNSFLALKISYANVIADLCEKNRRGCGGSNARHGSRSRIGEQFLRAGLGFGGLLASRKIFRPCASRRNGRSRFRNPQAAERVNKQRIDRFLEKVHQALWVVKGKRVAVLGLAFKANTDDVRFSPALEVARRMLAEGADVHATDPEAISRAEAVLPQVTYHHDPYEALRDAEAVLICTEWEEFRQLDCNARAS